MIADSIKNEMELQTGYMNMIRSILLGNMKPDSVEQLDSAKVKEIAHDFAKKTKAEEEFVSEFESQEKYNLSSISAKQNQDIFVFFRPVKGVISSSFNLAEKQYGLSIITSTGETVQSVLRNRCIPGRNQPPDPDRFRRYHCPGCQIQFRFKRLVSSA